MLVERGGCLRRWMRWRLLCLLLVQQRSAEIVGRLLQRGKVSHPRTDSSAAVEEPTDGAERGGANSDELIKGSAPRRAATDEQGGGRQQHAR